MGSILIPGFGLRFALNLRNVSRIFRIEVGGKARDQQHHVGSAGIP